MSIQQINSKNIWYPPGGILIWIIIFLELVTFGAALIAMAHYSNQEIELFHNSRPVPLGGGQNLSQNFE